MTNRAMTFHERYGNLPTRTLRLIKKFNVSQSDYDLMLDLLNPWIDGDDSMHGRPDWDAIDNHIVSNSETGMYRPRFF